MVKYVTIVCMVKYVTIVCMVKSVTIVCMVKYVTIVSERLNFFEKLTFYVLCSDAYMVKSVTIVWLVWSNM